MAPRRQEKDDSSGTYASGKRFLAIMQIVPRNVESPNGGVDVSGLP